MSWLFSQALVAAYSEENSLDGEPVCAVERDAYAAAVLAQRQNDGLLDLFPIWSDVETFDGKPWQEIVDVVSGGFPCQDISCAGPGKGLDGERSGLWKEFARIIREVQPLFAWVENSPILTSRGIDRVLWDLATMGYDAEWGVLAAEDVGALHKRDRIWILAYSGGVWQQQFSKAWNQEGYRVGNGCKNMANASGKRFQKWRLSCRKEGFEKAGPGAVNGSERCGETSDTKCHRRNPEWRDDRQNDRPISGASDQHIGKVPDTLRCGCGKGRSRRSVRENKQLRKTTGKNTDSKGVLSGHGDISHVALLRERSEERCERCSVWGPGTNWSVEPAMGRVAMTGEIVGVEVGNICLLRGLQ